MRVMLQNMGLVGFNIATPTSRKELLIRRKLTPLFPGRIFVQEVWFQATLSYALGLAKANLTLGTIAAGYTFLGFVTNYLCLVFCLELKNKFYIFPQRRFTMMVLTVLR